jgi:hypothetical protein
VALSDHDLDDLRTARRLLDSNGLAARVANMLGKPVEMLLERLPAGASEIARTAANKALTAAGNFAISSLPERPLQHSNGIHKVLAGMSGMIGGAFGLPALAVELPASTILMLRSIAEIARSEGESLAAPEARLACLQVFALGGPSSRDDAVESGYFAVRAALAKTLDEAAEYVATRGVARKGAPALVRFTTQVAARFGVPVSEKFVLQSVPVIGAVGGATLNVLFMDYFQGLARGHFIVRRLERKYGAVAVRDAY